MEERAEFPEIVEGIRDSLSRATADREAIALDLQAFAQQVSAMADRDPTREEIDAKIAASEARTDAKFERLSGKLDQVLLAIDGFKRDLGEARRQITDTGAATAEASNRTRRTVRNTIVATVLPTAVVIFLGLGALIVGIGQMNLSHIANLIGLFSALGGALAQ